MAARFTGCDAIVHAQLAVNALHLGANGIDGDDQFPRDFRIGVTRSEQVQHPLLLSRERLA